MCTAYYEDGAGTTYMEDENGELVFVRPWTSMDDFRSLLTETVTMSDSERVALMLKTLMRDTTGVLEVSWLSLHIRYFCQ
jgi:hypothetical protein